MARLFFNLHECGTVMLDPDGREVRDLAAARNHAIREARAIMCAEVGEGRLCLSCSIEVKDEAGATVLSMPFKEAVTVSGI